MRDGPADRQRAAAEEVLRIFAAFCRRAEMRQVRRLISPKFQ